MDELWRARKAVTVLQSKDFAENGEEFKKWENEIKDLRLKKERKEKAKCTWDGERRSWGDRRDSKGRGKRRIWEWEVRHWQRKWKTTPLLEQQQQKKKLLRHCGWFGRKKMTIYIANYQSKRGELKFMRVRENDPRVNITVID